MNDKFKTIDKTVLDSLYERVRYNDNTLGNHIEIKHGSITEDKKDYASIIIFYLQNTLGRFEDAKQISEEGNTNKIVRNMFNVSRQKIMEYSGDRHEL